MNTLSRIAREGGPKLVYGLMALAVVAAFAVGAWVVNPVDEAADVVAPGDPPVPPMLADHAERAPGEPRGETVGAAPSKTIARPNLYLEERGIKYNFYESPNWSPRGFNNVEAITVHVTGPGTCPGMRSWFSQPQSNASAHFGVCKDGSIEQYVELGDGAWHNGIVNRPDLTNSLIASWIGGGINPNSRTVGIELLLAPGENLNDYPAMRESFYVLMWWLSDNLRINLDRTHVIGHYQIDAINRSVDPRCCVDLDDVVSDLSGVAPEPSPVPTVVPTVPTPAPTATPAPSAYPFWDGERHVFEGGREGGWSWAPEPAPCGVWFYRDVAIWDGCDPSWGGSRASVGVWVHEGSWLFFESVREWIQAPERN